jgi:hydroxylaminobenzene mutase
MTDTVAGSSASGAGSDPGPRPNRDADSGWSSPDGAIAGPGLGLAPGSGLTFDPGPSSGSGMSAAPISGSELGTLSMSGAPAEATGRHPFDPDQVRCTKAAAVLALGVAAVITGPLIGGVVPAILALILARQAQDEIISGKGYLTGARQVRLGVVLAWIAIGLAVAALVAASVIGILSLAATATQDFPDTSD